MKYSTTTLTALLIPALLTALLSGCVTANRSLRHAKAGDYVDNPDYSQALNVAVATGLTDCNSHGCTPLRDVPRSRLPASMHGKTTVDLSDIAFDSLRLGVGVGQMAGLVNVVTGVGSIAGGLLTLGGLFTGPTPLKDPATQPTIVAWMPARMASDADTARHTMRRFMARALTTQTIDGIEFTPAADDHGDFTIAIDNASVCEDIKGGCHIRIGMHPPYDIVPEAPGFLTINGSVWSWTNIYRGATTRSDFHNIWLYITQPHKDSSQTAYAAAVRDYLIGISANLPGWVYIYLPPGPVTAYPTMLNQGQPLLFIEPVAQEKTTALQGHTD